MQLCQIMFLLFFYFLSGRAQEGLQLAYVVSVDNPTYDQEYQCVTEPGIENTNYSWYRQDWSELPEGVKAEGDRLHFLKETADLNGVYICKVANQYGEAAGSLYYHRINQIKGIHSEL
ncbi:hypothetical protein HF521_016058 [Silurus meridionalis]|uniref:Ig-like domain-containing protein n=1 Tax=Silurus meridionalis TaxID=175797 RepID=A0A8T0BQ90_SILME|nr:hypothetical protein HF521_016058 [Silurus meridionalis]